MAVRVRLFAGLREAAGTSELLVAPAALPELLAGLCERFGELFARRLAQSSVLIDGDHVERTSTLDVNDGAEIALLPPFSGGAQAARRPRGRARLSRAAAGELPLGAAVVAVVVIFAAAIGELAVGVVATLLAAAVVVELSARLAHAGARPLLPAAAIAGVGVPIAVTAGAGWAILPAGILATTLLAFLLVLVLGRREHVLETLAATVLVGAVAGLGGAGLVLLRSSPQGFRWLVVVAVLVAAAELAAAAVAWLRPGGQPVAELLAPVLAVAVAGALVGALAGDPVSGIPLMRVALVAAAAAVCSLRLRTAVAAAAVGATSAALGTLLAAPVAAALVTGGLT